MKQGVKLCSAALALTVLLGPPGAVARDTEKPIGEQIEDTRRNVVQSLRQAGRSLDEYFRENDAYIIISDLSVGAVSAKTLIGARVRDARGEAVATVEDLIIDESGDLRVIVVAQGGFLGVGEKTAPVPARNVVVYWTEEGRIELRTDLTGDELARASGTVYVVRSEVAGGGNEDLLAASTLMKANVVNPRGVDMAALDDVIFNRRRDVTHVILSVGGFLGVGDKRVAVPLDSLTIIKTREGLKLELDTSRETLEALPAFRYDVPSE